MTLLLAFAVVGPIVFCLLLILLAIASAGAELKRIGETLEALRMAWWKNS